MTPRRAVAKIAIIAIPAVLIVAAAVGIYYYTSLSGTVITTTGIGVTTTGSVTATSGAYGGWQDSSGQPQGAWGAYLGYVPTGYSLSPHYPNAATYPCPSGMDPAQCTQFKASCGNGVCDPNESCATCPIDCGVSGQLTCDPYTGRAGAPISICQVGNAG